MRNTRGNGSSSRFEMRRNKSDRWLNWTVGIVSVLILAIGCIILVSVFSTSSADKTASQTHSAQSGMNSGTSNKNKSGGTSARSNGTGSNQVSNSERAASSASSSSAVPQNSGESHQASYDIGSADWNAQVTAIAGATGIDQNNMVILWLGNGGSPNSSLARVASKTAQSSVYVVHLIYQAGKWQADQVQKPQ
ncbi:YrrS family protein [Sporolactobacillus putidus]|uniref:Membrane protein YrrS n=1 Tax=Sporolactobacillus putidus TaxID=492735 RepID=A0A917VYX0_9BACL|nr:YrrS family protein [Sporolactobacillus putidus]GGL40672.1 putative membrane protein YrrS [Sporolactobacillus putidus]